MENIEDKELELLMAELEAEGAAMDKVTEVEKTVESAFVETTSSTVEDDEMAALEELEKEQPEPVAVSESELEVQPRDKVAKPRPPFVPVIEEPTADEELSALTTSVEESDIPKTSEKAGNPYELQHYVDPVKFNAETRVTEATLDACMIEQNGLRAYYGTLAAKAEAQAARIKARFEVIEATLYDKVRKELAASGEKTTEKMVENAVKLDPMWLKAKNAVIEADTIASINKSMVESLKDRRDMIIQLGADRRDEYKGAARVLAEREEREALAERATASAKKALGNN